MKGVNTTAPLKFDHPGLETIATRYDGCLVIQNELGTTAGHRLVIRVAGMDVTISYADARRSRCDFFAQLLEPSGPSWEWAPARPGEIVAMTGRARLADRAGIEGFLTFLGSRLVFLIDWNRARKQLTRVLRKRDAVAVLKWAADNDVGHLAFLQSGGLGLISTAADRVAPAALRYGARLDELLGLEAALSFLQFVLRLTSSGLQQQRSPRLIQDEIEAELLLHLRTAEVRAIDAAADHAWLLSSLVERIREILETPAVARPADAASGLARLARTWESRADDIVRDAGRLPAAARDARLAPLLESADEAADALEETAFLLTLPGDPVAEAGAAGLARLAAIVCEEGRAYVCALEHARVVARRRTRAAVADLLLAVDRIAALEHDADAAERAARAAIVETSRDFRELHTLADAARGLEHAADAIAHCGRLLRDHALSSGDLA
jgi:uncharacterized protein Yka (UPF0111/DUF47 family)